MDQEELKRKLLGLWEKTTHNSKELLATLFEYYFDIKYIEYKEIDGKVVCALCGIPYEFGNKKHQLKGLYIIPLTSEEGYQKRGNLSSLLDNINLRLKDEFDFTFLVPQTDLMADYFGTRGYLSSFFILEERFTPLHDFKNDYRLSLLDSDERIRNLKLLLWDEIRVEEYESPFNFPVEEVVDFIKDIERKIVSAVNLHHTSKDIEYLLGDDSLRNLSIFVAFDNDRRITGVAFTEKDDLKRTNVVATYVSDTCSYYVLLDFIKHRFIDHSLSVVTSDSKYQVHSLAQQIYVSTNPIGGDFDNSFDVVEIPFNLNKLLQPLGMVRLLRFDNIFSYVASTRSDVEFKLHIRNYKDNLETVDAETASTLTHGDSYEVLIVKDGECEKTTFDNKKTDRTILDLTVKEVSELLLRKNDSSNLIMEAFGIPRLNLQIRLLPVK